MILTKSWSTEIQCTASMNLPLPNELHLRCPYCVEGFEFRLMLSSYSDGLFVCRQCGHKEMPKEPDFVCQCEKCRALRQAA